MLPEIPKLAAKKDVFIIAGLLLAALLLWLLLRVGQDGQPRLAEIRHDGSLVETVALTADRRFSPEGMPQVVFEVRDGGIAFVESDCPDKVCIHAGRLHLGGQRAACLPNKLTVTVVAADDSQLDAVLQ